jgi:hypothetical protein
MCAVLLEGLVHRGAPPFLTHVTTSILWRRAPYHCPIVT